MIMRGLYVGDDNETFTLGAKLSQKVNLDLLDKPLQKVLVYLDPHEFKSTWLGNKAIYRTRMAMADDGDLIILAPGLKEFGEDSRSIGSSANTDTTAHRPAWLRSKPTMNCETI